MARFLLIFWVIFWSATVQAEATRILISNDDGIESDELAILVAELNKHYEVVVCAPRFNQSGSSQATTSGPVKVEKIYKDGNFFGYGVHAKPADAVKFGLLELGKDQPFDLVVSGINRGANTGNIARLSGTVGAAMHAQFLGYPSIATSQDPRADTQLTAKITLDVVRKFLADGAPLGTVLSINVPAGTPKGIVVKEMGGAYLGSSPYQVIEKADESTTVYESRRTLISDEDKDNDTRAYLQGYVTITPLKFDSTDVEYSGTVKKWSIGLP